MHMQLCNRRKHEVRMLAYDSDVAVTVELPIGLAPGSDA